MIGLIVVFVVINTLSLGACMLEEFAQRQAWAWMIEKDHRNASLWIKVMKFARKFTWPFKLTIVLPMEMLTK